MYRVLLEGVHEFQHIYVSTVVESSDVLEVLNQVFDGLVYLAVGRHRS